MKLIKQNRRLQKKTVNLKIDQSKVSNLNNRNIKYSKIYVIEVL